MLDTAASQVPPTPTSTTVHELLSRSEPAHWHVDLVRHIDLETSGRKKAVEGTVWKLTDVELVEWKTEADRDVHLVVRDKGGPANEVLDLEFPDTHCQGVASSPLKEKIAEAREALIANGIFIGDIERGLVQPPFWLLGHWHNDQPPSPPCLAPVPPYSRTRNHSLSRLAVHVAVVIRFFVEWPERFSKLCGPCL
jgi:hypothetical protein